MYAYELPPETFRRSESPTDIMRDSEDTSQPLEEPTVTSVDDVVEKTDEGVESVTSGSHQPASEPTVDTKNVETTVDTVDSKNDETESTENATEELSQNGMVATTVHPLQEGSAPDTDELSSTHDAKQHQEEVESENLSNQTSSPSKQSQPQQEQQPLPTYCSPRCHKFIFAVHRRTVCLYCN